MITSRPKSVICEILDNLMKKKDSITVESELERALTDLFLIAEDRLKKCEIRATL